MRRPPEVEDHELERAPNRAAGITPGPVQGAPMGGGHGA